MCVVHCLNSQDPTAAQFHETWVVQNISSVDHETGKQSEFTEKDNPKRPSDLIPDFDSHFDISDARYSTFPSKTGEKLGNFVFFWPKVIDQTQLDSFLTLHVDHPEFLHSRCLQCHSNHDCRTFLVNSEKKQTVYVKEFCHQSHISTHCSKCDLYWYFTCSDHSRIYAT